MVSVLSLQVNAILDATQISFGVPREMSAVVLTILVAFVTVGGIQSIAKSRR
ncbi:alanine:cation symporter family protein [Vibrio metschnikovii]